MAELDFTRKADFNRPWELDMLTYHSSQASCDFTAV